LEGEGAVAPCSGVVGGEAALDGMPAMAEREGTITSGPAAGRGRGATLRVPGDRAQRIGERLEALGPYLSIRSRRSVVSAPGGAAAPFDSGRERRVVLGPQPVRTGPGNRDPGRDAPGADDHAPMLAVGVGGIRSRGCDIDPRDQAESAGSAA